MKNFSLRNKLMIITSGLIIVSLVVLSIISIRYFTQDTTNLIKVQTNDTAKLISEKLKTEIAAKVDALTIFDRLADKRAVAPVRRRRAKVRSAAPPSSADMLPAASGILRVSRYVYAGGRTARILKRDVS